MKLLRNIFFGTNKQKDSIDELDYILTSLPEDKKQLETLFKERKDEIAHVGGVNKFKDS